MVALPEAAPKKHSSLSRLRAFSTEWLWRTPAPDAPVWHRYPRAFIRIILVFCRQFAKDNIPLRASALTLTVVLSLVPALALGTAVLKGLGGGDQARQAAYKLIDQLELQGRLTALEHSSPPEGMLSFPPDKTLLPEEFPPEAAPGEITAHLRRAADQIFDYVERTDFGTLGTFGVLLLVLAVMLTLGSIESTMNAIWSAQRQRPIGRRCMDYLALAILLPLATNLALATEATLQHPALLSKVQKMLPFSSGIGHAMLPILTITLVIATFSLLYRFLPNTRVTTAAALAGGFFAGIFWFLAQAIFIRIQIVVTNYNAIYGSFATLPLFLIWLQFAWIIFLSGAEMAFSFQFYKNYQPAPEKLSPAARLALTFNVIATACTDFKNRRLTTSEILAHELSQPEKTINSILAELTTGGILHRVEEKGGGYVLASPPDKINPSEIIDLILGTEVPPLKGSHLAITAMQAARQAVSHQRIGPGL